VNRALRATTVGVLLLSPLAFSACSAGQVTQTATQERDKTGAMAQVGDITVRAAELENPRAGAYERGDDAELRLAIVNSGQEDDTLVGVDGDGFGGVEFATAGASASSTSAGSSSAPATGTSAAPATGSGASTSATGTPGTTGSAPATATGTSAAPTPSTSATSGSATGGSDELEIPADSTVFVDGEAATITLTDLADDLTPGQYLEVTLTFENAGELTLPVTVANPDESVERGDAFDFHEEEGTAGEAAREGESAREESGGQ
jgi:copper(I)-binding protein